jgi:hypothetical protein
VDFGIDTAGVTIQWSFAFAAYSHFTSDLTKLNASPIETDATAAGTPGVMTFNADLLQVGDAQQCRLMACFVLCNGEQLMPSRLCCHRLLALSAWRLSC